MSKKAVNIDLDIVDIEFPNKGYGYYNDNKVTVKNTIPGQKVNIDLKKKRKKYEGYLLNIIKNAEYEIKSECSDFGICGGCTFQNISYEKELDIKKNNVLKLLNDGNIKNFEFLGIKGSPITKCYRNKMEFSFGDSGLDGELTVGMRKRNSFYEVVNADNCLIIDEDIQKILEAVRQYFIETKETFYHKFKHTGTLRHLVIRKSYFTKEILVNLITSSNLNLNENNFVNRLVNLKLDGNIKGILHTINDSLADAVKCDKLNLLYGQDFIIEKLLDLSFKISVFSFFQTNSAGAEVLYSCVREFAGNINDKVVFDLYCGTGTISQIMACKAKKVIGIEIVEEAVKSAKENAEINNIKNCEFISGDVLKKVDELDEKPDLIILDPPREGINPKAINKLIDFNAERLIYISCKASSMVKDLTSFLESGYELKKVECIDMFPRTYWVEVVCLLQRIDM